MKCTSRLLFSFRYLITCNHLETLLLEVIVMASGLASRYFVYMLLIAFIILCNLLLVPSCKQSRDKNSDSRHVLTTSNQQGTGGSVDTKVWRMYGANCRHTFSVSAAGPESGCVLWQTCCDSKIVTTPVYLSNNYAVFAADDGYVSAVDQEGTRLWKYKTNSHVYDSVTVSDTDNIFIATSDGVIHALDFEGQVLWVIELSRLLKTGISVGFLCPPTYSDEGILYAQSAHERTLLAVSAEGSLLWKHAFGGKGGGVFSPVIDQEGNVYVGGSPENIGRISVLSKKGKPLRVIDVSNSYLNSPTILQDESLLVFCSIDGLIRVDDLGELSWIYDYDGISFSPAAVRSDGCSYINYIDGSLHAVSDTGERLWKVQEQDTIIGAPAVDGKGNAYMVSGKALYSVGSKGETNWRLKLDSTLTTGASISPNGIIYVGSTDGTLYAIGNANGTIGVKRTP